jgi:Cdc6-like AAA superfamily ATPase
MMFHTRSVYEMMDNDLHEEGANQEKKQCFMDYYIANIKAEIAEMEWYCIRKLKHSKEEEKIIPKAKLAQMMDMLQKAKNILPDMQNEEAKNLQQETAIKLLQEKVDEIEKELATKGESHATYQEILDEMERLDLVASDLWKKEKYYDNEYKVRFCNHLENSLKRAREE